MVGLGAEERGGEGGDKGERWGKWKRGELLVERKSKSRDGHGRSLVAVARLLLPSCGCAARATYGCKYAMQGSPIALLPGHSSPALLHSTHASLSIPFPAFYLLLAAFFLTVVTFAAACRVPDEHCYASGFSFVTQYATWNMHAMETLCRTSCSSETEHTT